MLPSVFSYVFNREPGERGRTFLSEIKKSYIRKSLLLAFFIPLDIVIYLVFLIFNPFRCQFARIVFVTDIFPALVARSSTSLCCFVGAPNLLLQAIRNRGVYIPASLVYIFLALSRWNPSKSRGMGADFAIRLLTVMLRPFVSTGSVMVFHSDALPFGRSVLFAGKRLGLRTCCIQHGIFHQSSAISEVDGYLCDVNVVRSSQDGELIRQASPETSIVVEPDFFLRCDIDEASDLLPDRSGKKIIVLGEGWRLVDAKFSERYMQRIQQMANDLLVKGFDVVFRPHPSERGLGSRYGFDKVDAGPLDDCIASANAIIGYSSTVLFEAASLGVLACQIDVDRQHFPGLSRDGVMIEKICTAGDVAVALNARKFVAYPDRHERKRAAVERVFKLLQASL